MNNKIPEFQAHLTDDSSHPGIVGRFTAIHTLPLVHPSEMAGEHNFIPHIVTIPCLTPICHTKSMIAESAKTDKINSAPSKCYSVTWSITMGFELEYSRLGNYSKKLPIDDGSNPSSTIASLRPVRQVGLNNTQYMARTCMVSTSAVMGSNPIGCIASWHFFPYPKNEIHHPLAGLHTNYRSELDAIHNIKQP